MTLSGDQLIGFGTSRQGDQEFHGVDPRSGDSLGSTFVDATEQEVDRALTLAAEAFKAMDGTGREARAAFLDQIGQNLLDLGDELIARTSAETALPEARLQGERGRTVGQLGAFAALIREGSYVGARIDHAQPDRQPLPKPDVRRMLVPVGPVVVFGASNFPLAFSVAGGDTASALAAGCPVVVKGHPNHPGASEMVGRAIIAAAEKTGMPEGIFSLVQGAGHGVGLALVRHPLTTAVGFTGSLRGGRALFDAAAARPVPVPVYAEMGSTNPVFLLADKLAAEAESLADGFHSSITMGVGQFCTNPGVMFAVAGEATDRFVDRLAEQLGAGAEGTMLHAGIRHAFDSGIGALADVDGVELRAQGQAGDGPCAVRPALLTTDLATYRTQAQLREEVFGPATLVVRCDNEAQLLEVASELDGQLTATIHGTNSDLERLGALPRALQHKAGRVLLGGFPTGVEVCPSMQHGGPYPSTTDGRTNVRGHRVRRALVASGLVPELHPKPAAQRAPRRQPRRHLAHGRRRAYARLTPKHLKDTNRRG